jgi:hypothetical protein
MSINSKNFVKHPIKLAINSLEFDLQKTGKYSLKNSKKLIQKKQPNSSVSFNNLAGTNTDKSLILTITPINLMNSTLTNKHLSRPIEKPIIDTQILSGHTLVAKDSTKTPEKLEITVNSVLANVPLDLKTKFRPHKSPKYLSTSKRANKHKRNTSFFDKVRALLNRTQSPTV